MRFDLTDLRLFLAVVDAGSITHGAAEVGLSLPAASERLRDMEAIGEVLLLHRGRRGATPTEAGETLAHHARTILHQMAVMRGDIHQYAKGLRATVRIFANTAATTEFLPAGLATWMATHPGIDVDLRERKSAEIVKSIASGFADMGVISDAVDTGALILRPFAVDRLVAIASSSDPVARKGPVRFADLLDQPFIGLASGALQDHIEDQALRSGGRLRIRARLHSFSGVCRMVAGGAGIAIVPQTAARRSKRSTRITILRLQDQWATRRLSVCVRSLDELSAPTKSLLDHLCAF